jgi:hypothetical protein
VTAPEQHSPPVYGCAAGAVLHRHAGDTLEPAVLLHTFLPPGVEDQLREAPARVDVHGDGPGSGTVTVRVLTDGQSLSWQLPITPFIAALPGQPGDDGRMVLLGLVDAEPEPGFWAHPADCEHLAAELQLPVADLVDALRGRLTPWLVEDLDLLLHDDAHDRAVDRSPAQTLASAVIAHYRGDLVAEQATVRLLRALELAPDDFSVELGSRLCTALVSAMAVAEPGAVGALLEQTGPFETEAIRLLTALPAELTAVPPANRTETAMNFLLAGADRDETVGAAVSVIARLARLSFGPDLADEDVLRRLGMVDDAGLSRLARIWVDLAAGASGPAARDDVVAGDIALRVQAEGPPGLDWFRGTAATLAAMALEVAGRNPNRVAEPVQAVTGLLDDDTSDLAAGTRAVLTLARYVRGQGRLGPVLWLAVPTGVATQAVTHAYLDGLDREVVVDLLAELLEEDVEGVDLLDGFICATSQLLAHLDQQEDPELRRAQVGELLGAVPGGPRGNRWLLAACLREAPGHDAAAADLAPYLGDAPAVDPDRAAAKSGRTGTLSAGLEVLEALAAVLGEPAQMTREELLGLVLPSALAEHDLIRRPAPILGEQA